MHRVGVSGCPTSEKVAVDCPPRLIGRLCDPTERYRIIGNCSLRYRVVDRRSLYVFFYPPFLRDDSFRLFGRKRVKTRGFWCGTIGQPVVYIYTQVHVYTCVRTRAYVERKVGLDRFVTGLGHDDQLASAARFLPRLERELNERTVCRERYTAQLINGTVLDGESARTRNGRERKRLRMLEPNLRSTVPRFFCF